MRKIDNEIRTSIANGKNLHTSIYDVYHFEQSSRNDPTIVHYFVGFSYRNTCLFMYNKITGQVRVFIPFDNVQILNPSNGEMVSPKSKTTKQKLNVIGRDFGFRIFKHKFDWFFANNKEAFSGWHIIKEGKE